MMTRRAFVSAAFVAGCARAQDDAVFTTEVKVVNILANVLGRNGEIVNELSKEEFSVRENGRVQAIRYFSRQTDLPLTIGLMVDTSMSQRRVLDAERGASLQFLDAVLRENKDKVFLMQFDMGVQMRQPLTASRRQLDEALAFVDTPTRRELSQQSGGGTLMFDAVMEASAVTVKQTGRKALILLTDGDDNGSTATEREAIDAAQKADTLIFSILFSDGATRGRRPLMEMARETGGAFFEVSKKLTIGQIYKAIEDELRGQYSIGYVSDEPVRVSEFRKLSVVVGRKGVTVQARERYWAKR